MDIVICNDLKCILIKQELCEFISVVMCALVFPCTCVGVFLPLRRVLAIFPHYLGRCEIWWNIWGWVQNFSESLECGDLYGVVLNKAQEPT